MPKREENRSVRFSSLLGTSHLSTDRGSPPRINARGLTGTVSLGSSHDVGASIQISQRRGDYLDASASVRHRTLAVRRRSAIRRKEKGFPKGKGKQPERGFPFSFGAPLLTFAA